MQVPMFPLGLVVFPFTAIPLRVFEPRYQHLLDDVLAADRSFGTVLIERGSEVGGGDERFDVGTMVRVASVERLPEGDQRQIVVAAVSRIRIEQWLGEEPYPRAEVSEWPDESEKTDPELVDEVEVSLRRVMALAGELGADTGGMAADLPTDPVTASYQASALTPVTSLDSYSLLTESGPTARLRRCRRLLEESAEQIRAQLGS